jgi:thioesterase domain-containing protein
MEMDVRVSHDRFALRVAIRSAIIFVISLLFSNGAFAETQVYFLRGWFGVFSTGMDAMAEELKGKGIKAEAIGHLAWKATVTKIVSERAAGKTGPLVLIGHSQGANNVIEMAQELEKKKIPVDLLITLAPYLQEPVPGNVVKAVDFYQVGGWGAPLTGAGNFRGKISNIDMAGETDASHVNMDKSAKVQSMILREIAAVSQVRQAAPAR